MKHHYLGSEPRGEALRALLTHALGPCDGLLLVEPDEGLSEAGAALLDALEPHRAGRGRAGAWPGHTLPRGAATLHYYHWNEDVCAAVCAAADGLFQWTWPALPEGLFLQQRETPWLVSQPRLGRAYVDASEEELAALREAAPALELSEEGA